MTQKGLILKIEKNHIIVLTDEHDYLKLRVKDRAVVGQKIFFTEEDLYTSSWVSHWRTLDNKRILSIASLFIAVILIGGIWGMNGSYDPNTNMILASEDSLVATVLTIDINPSVKLSLDQADVVLSVKAINADAKTLNFDGIVGMPAETAVERIVILAREAGFINEDDLEDDYVLITTVPMNQKSKQHLETLNDKLETKIAESTELQNVNVALMKAEKRAIFEAEGKKIPIGLYVVNGKIEIDDKTLTVKEYFSDTKRVEAFKEKGEIIDKKHENEVALAAKFIQKLEDAGVEGTEALKAKLEDKDTDVRALLQEIKVLWSTVEDNEDATEQVKGKKDKSTDDTETSDDEDDDEKIEDDSSPDGPGKGKDKDKNKGN